MSGRSLCSTEQIKTRGLSKERELELEPDWVIVPSQEGHFLALITFLFAQPEKKRCNTIFVVKEVNTLIIGLYDDSTTIMLQNDNKFILV